jgi:hypothetical protein
LLPNVCKIDLGRALPIPRRAESMIERYKSRRK